MATVVGLAGGFLFAWVLARRNEVLAERHRHLASLLSFESDLSQLRARLEQVIVGANEALSRIERTRSAGATPQHIPGPPTISHSSYTVKMPTDEEFELLRLLPAECEKLIAAVYHSRAQLAEMIVSGTIFGGATADAYRGLSPRADPFAASGLSAENLWSGLRQQRSHAAWVWTSHEQRFTVLRDAVLDFRQRIVPRAIFWLLGVLGGLLVAGVLVPTAFLSAGEGAAKWWLLGVAGSLAVAFFGFLVVEVVHLRGAVDLGRDHF